MDWPVKVIPQGFSLNNQPYPSMRDLSNGFKLMFQNLSGGKALLGGQGMGGDAGGIATAAGTGGGFGRR